MTKNLGSVFAEEIVKGQKRRFLRKDFDDDSQNLPAQAGLQMGRFFLIVLIFIFSLGLLLAKLFTLNILEGDKYHKLSSENRIRETKIFAPRGIIYDRNKHPLVRNIPTFKMPDGEIFYETIPATATGKIAESVSRDYIYKEDNAHVIGFVAQANEQEIKSHKQTLGGSLGKMGIEKAYDEILRGTDGKTLQEVDALGQVVRVLGNVDPVSGDNLTLSIDQNLQTIARHELEGKKGIVLAQNPKNGEILTLFSSPSFDPNKVIRNEDLESIFSDKNQPFFNRVITGLYPPGSTFKIITAIAALESGAINKNTKIEDTGILQVGQFSFGNWYFLQYGKKEGMVDIISALKRSNDIFFYKTGEATGIDILSAWGKKIGLGSTLGIDIEGEAAGVMPDPVWRQKVRGTDWFLGDTYHVAIGQGDLQVTPLQMNAWTNVIANNGKICRPHLVSNLSHLGNLCKDLGIKKETISLIKEGMKEACSPASPAGGPGGTGWPFFQFKVESSKFKVDGIDFLDTYESTTSANKMVGIPVACKTGTAEFGDPNNRTHAWFTVFAPVVNPQISVTVLVEEGGEGSNVAAPIAKKILEKWFGN